MLIQIDGLGSGRTLGSIPELRVSAQSGLRSEGITSIVVTHRPSLIAHVDKILMLGAGRVPAALCADAFLRHTKCVGHQHRMRQAAPPSDHLLQTAPPLKTIAPQLKESPSMVQNNAHSRVNYIATVAYAQPPPVPQ